MENDYVHIFFNLVLVIGILLFVFYFLKRFSVQKFNKNKHIKIINIVPVGSKEKIILMNVSNTILLVGATPSHIETLYAFSDLNEVEGQIEKLTQKDFQHNEIMSAKK